MSPIGKNQWAIRTLKEAAAVCGSSEKEKKGEVFVIVSQRDETLTQLAT